MFMFMNMSLFRDKDGDEAVSDIYRVRVMLFNATFNNISVISWRSLLLVEKTRVPRETHRPVASH
jgi:hypothetical protein